MDSKIAEFIRWIDAAEPLDELTNDAKALTWEHECEHAVVVVRPGRRALVRGGRLGIEFLVEESEPDGPPGEPTLSLFIDVNGARMRVDGIVFHTHPVPTGPSDWDLKVLEMLGQAESRILEIGGERDGTVIRPRRKATP